MRRALGTLAAVGAALVAPLLLGAGPASAATTPVPPWGNGLYRVPNEASHWVNTHPTHPDKAVVYSKIAGRPDAFWVVDNAGDAALAEHARAARKANRTLTVVLYNVPGRDDGVGGAPGAASTATYQAWVKRMSTAIGSTRAIVVVEPDALWFADRIAARYGSAARDTRLYQLKWAARWIDQKNPNAHVYLEAGTTSGSVTAERMARLLKMAGASSTIGFAVNVSSYSPESALSTYARRIRSALWRNEGVGGSHFVADTGRNGNPSWGPPYPWCNPAGRLLGKAPGKVGVDGRDFNLWIKGPATSDGPCGVGPLTYGGQFMPTEAARMARAAG